MAIMIYLLYLREDFNNVIWCGDMNVARAYPDIHNGLMTERKLTEAKKYGEPPSRIKELERRIAGAKQGLKYGGGAGLRLKKKKDWIEFYKMVLLMFLELFIQIHTGLLIGIEPK